MEHYRPSDAPRTDPLGASVREMRALVDADPDVQHQRKPPADERLADFGDEPEALATAETIPTQTTVLQALVGSGSDGLQARRLGPGTMVRLTPEQDRYVRRRMKSGRAQGDEASYAAVVRYLVGLGMDADLERLAQLRRHARTLARGGDLPYAHPNPDGTVSHAQVQTAQELAARQANPIDPDRPVDSATLAGLAGLRPSPPPIPPPPPRQSETFDPTQLRTPTTQRFQPSRQPNEPPAFDPTAL